MIDLFNRKKLRERDEEIQKLNELVAYEVQKVDHFLKRSIELAKKLDAQKVISIALNEYGESEIRGNLDNKRILEYFTAVDGNFQHDEISWCAAFVNWCLREAHITGTFKAAAKSFCSWKGGELVPLYEARLGDIVIFNRGDPRAWTGHVGFFIACRGNSIFVLGGNQSNKVCISAQNLSDLNCIRRPITKKK